MKNNSVIILQESLELNDLLEKALRANGWTWPIVDSDVKDLEVDINDALKLLYPPKELQTIKLSTLRRLFKREKYDKKFNVSETLNPLAKLAGYKSLAAFLRDYNMENFQEDDVYPTTYCKVDIFDDADNLEVGKTFLMGWHSRRYVEIQYIGNCEFKILKYAGTGPDQTGRVITARWFEIVEVPPGPGRLRVTRDIAGVLGNEEYDRIYL